MKNANLTTLIARQVLKHSFGVDRSIAERDVCAALYEAGHGGVGTSEDAHILSV